MTINFDGIPAKGAELVHRLGGATDTVGEAIKLDAIVIHKSRQVTYAVVCGHLYGFPNLAFLNFTVAADSVYAVVEAIDTGCERHAECRG